MSVHLYHGHCVSVASVILCADNYLQQCPGEATSSPPPLAPSAGIWLRHFTHFRMFYFRIVNAQHPPEVEATDKVPGNCVSRG